MPIFKNFQRDIAALFGFDAVNTQNRRKAPDGILRSEDAEQTEADRRKLQSAGRDIRRNFTIAAWAVRRHLDYVTTFSFQANTGDDAKNDQLEAFVREWSKAENFDAAGRHGLAASIRMAEGARTIDGDVLAVRLADGRVQWVESDRIRASAGLPPHIDPAKIVHGVYTNDAGRALAYAISRRGSAGLAGQATTFYFERMVAAQNAYLHAYLDRFDQIRGISPLATALNELRDTYEAFDYARAKMKVSQLLGLVFYRNAAEDDSPQPQTDSDGYPTIDYGKGPWQLDLDPGDRAEYLESATPSTEFQQFSQTMIAVALKALDIPYSFFDESWTNYSGARGALQQYDRSAERKRAENAALLDWLTTWRLHLALADGELPGLKPSDLRWLWVPRGLPWIDPLKEVLANKEAIAAGLDTRTRILREQNREFKDVVAELKAEAELLRDAGLPLTTDPSNATIAALAEKEAPAHAAA